MSTIQAADTYRAAAASLREMLPRLAEPDQQAAVAAALSLDHAARLLECSEVAP